ncbi:hypothetical protein JD844_016038 [Phrynosoma platyrhinos]|uniref:Uncharacterized protein n=1 Tax=Phrynosoma platyrhinos TaxID=52577 RepID=A0ABQ7SJT8_PHRPL|nr:hypothetical protein JD844_016038 [Phrynosoma platyrhinos]
MQQESPSNNLTGAAESIVTMEKDGSLLHVQIWHGKKTLIRRRLVYGTMVEELIIGSAIHKRQYKRA